MKRRNFVGLLAVPAVATAKLFPLENAIFSTPVNQSLSTTDQEGVLLRLMLECNDVQVKDHDSYELHIEQARIESDGKTTDHCIIVKPYAAKSNLHGGILHLESDEVKSREELISIAYNAFMNSPADGGVGLPNSFSVQPLDI